MDIMITLLVGIGGILLGVPWSVGARNDRNRLAQKLATMKQVEGVVTRIRAEERSDSGDGLSTTEVYKTPMVEYEVNKIRYIIPVRLSLELGDKVMIAYNPALPSGGMLTTCPAPYAFATGCIMVVVGVGLVALAMLGHPVLD